MFSALMIAAVTLLALSGLIGASAASSGQAAAQPASVTVQAAPEHTTVEALPSIGDIVDTISPIPRILKNPTDPKNYACLNPLINAACTMSKGLGKAAEALKGTVFAKIINDMIAGFEKMLMWSLSWWITLPSPNLSGDGMMQLTQKIYDYTFYIQLLGLTASVMFVGFRMLQTQQGIVEESEDFFRTLIRAVFGTAILGSILALATKASDAFSTWLLKSSIGSADAGQLVKNMVKLDLLTNHLGYSVMGLILFFGVIGALVQLVLLVVRQAMLIVVVSAIPVAAASSGTGVGSSAYQKMMAWLVAFLLFKPVGALVYMIAFTAGRTSEKNPYLALLSVILLTLAALVLPALLRLVSPAVGTMGGSGGAGLIGGLIGGGAALAARKGGGGGGGGGSNSGSTPISSRGQSGPQPTPPSPGNGPGTGAGKHAAIGGAKAGAAAGGGGAAAGAAGGPVGAAVGAAATGVGKATGAVKDAAGGEADGGGAATPNPTGGSQSPAASSTPGRVPPLTSGTGEHRMAA